MGTLLREEGAASRQQRGNSARDGLAARIPELKPNMQEGRNMKTQLNLLSVAVLLATVALAQPVALVTWTTLANNQQFVSLKPDSLRELL